MVAAWIFLNHIAYDILGAMLTRNMKLPIVFPWLPMPHRRVPTELDYKNARSAISKSVFYAASKPRPRPKPFPMDTGSGFPIGAVIGDYWHGFTKASLKAFKGICRQGFIYSFDCMVWRAVSS